MDKGNGAATVSDTDLLSPFSDDRKPRAGAVTDTAVLRLMLTQKAALRDHLGVAVSGRMRAMPHLPTPPDMPATIKAVIDAIGHAVRTEILRRLSSRPQTVRELADATGTVVSQVRKHLAILEELDLVRADRPSDERGPGRGRVVLWETNRERVREVGQGWIDYVTESDSSTRR